MSPQLSVLVSPGLWISASARIAQRIWLGFKTWLGHKKVKQEATITLLRTVCYLRIGRRPQQEQQSKMRFSTASVFLLTSSLVVFGQDAAVPEQVRYKNRAAT